MFAHVFEVTSAFYEYEATAREQEAALAYKDWIILYEFSPIVADQPETRAPILIRPERLTIWVHEVRFSWRPSDASEWTTHEARCEPWTPEVTLPVQLFPHRAGLSLAWPGPKPTEKAEQLTFTIRVHYSVSQDGPRWWRECDGGIWSWQ